MKTVDEVRLYRLGLLIEREGGLTPFCEKYGRSKSQVSQWMSGSINTGTGKSRKIGTSSCRSIEKHFGLQLGWMDLDPDLGGWPFETILLERFMSLSERQRALIEGYLGARIDDEIRKNSQAEANLQVG